MSSFPNSSNLDDLLLQSLMAKLQIRPPTSNNNSPFLPQSLEDLLFDVANRLDADDDDNKTPLAKEESKLEKEIIRVILSGSTDSLKPNSGKAVAIGDHHICVGFHEEKGSDYRVWEWHGHIMFFDEENGFSPEYIYGNYFERLQGKVTPVAGEEKSEEEVDDKDEKLGNLGLRELIDGGDSGGARILHRNINASSPRILSLLALSLTGSFELAFLILAMQNAKMGLFGEELGAESSHCFASDGNHQRRQSHDESVVKLSSSS